MILPDRKCLENLAKEHNLSSPQKDVFIMRFTNDMNVSDREIAEMLRIKHGAYRSRLTEIYKKFNIPGESSGKFKELEKIVNTKCGIPFSPILKEYLEEMSPVYRFYGRDDELNELLEHTKKCRLITIRGMKGIGKTYLAVKLVEKVKELSKFEYVIWSDLRRISSFDDVVDSLIKRFNISPGKNPTKQLINYFQDHKCLLILDDVTAVVKLERAEYDKYLDFLKIVADCSHKSCLILTGYEFPKEIKNYTNGKQLISGSFDTTLMLWDVTNLKPINIFKGDKGHKSGILSVSFHPTEPIVASGGHDQTIKLWDVNTGECLKTLAEHEGAVESICFSKDPSILVSSSQDQTIRIWDINTGKCLQKLEPDKPYKGMKITNAKLSISKSTLIDLGASEY